MYSKIRRLPVLISAVTCMPAERARCAPLSVREVSSTVIGKTSAPVASATGEAWSLQFVPPILPSPRDLRLSPLQLPCPTASRIE